MATTDIAATLLSHVSEPPWIVHGFIPQGHLIILAGEEGVGKSYLCFVLAVAAASGLPFLGYPTEPTRVLYFDEENSKYDHAQYLQWAWRGLGCPPIGDLTERLRIEHFTLSRAWQEQMEGIVKPWQPGLIIVDTVTPALNIQEENDNTEGGKAIQALRRLQGLTQGRASIILLKHAKFTGEDHARRTIRGAKVWLGATDATYFHVLNRGRARVDGLRGTQIIPEKSRAFGLRGIIRVKPKWEDHGGKGLSLKGELDMGSEGSE